MRSRLAVGVVFLGLYASLSDAKAADDIPAASEIIVSARRYEERLQDAPLPATVFQPEQIDARSSINLADLAEFAPNVGFDSTAPLSGGSNAAVIFIRGVGQTDFAITTDPGIGVYVDGVYLARATGADLDLLDVAQVEILRGPQGTLFGRNTIGGAISLSTRKPVLGTTSGEVEATYGRFDRFDLRTAINLSLMEGAAIRFAAARQKREGFGRRLLTGQRLGGQDRYALRMSALWQPTAAVEARLIVDYSSADEQSPVSTLAITRGAGSIDAPLTIFTGLLYNNLIGNPAPCQRLDFVVPFCGLPGLIALPALPPDTPAFDGRWITGNPFTSLATGPTGSRYDILGVTGVVNWQLGDARLKSTTGYRSSDFAFGRDPDSSPLVMVDTSNAVEHEQFSQELELSGGHEGALRWVLGAYYLREHASENIAAPLGQAAFDAINRLGLGCTYLPGLTGLPAPITLTPCPNPFAITMLGAGVQVRNRSIAGFGEATFPLAGNFSLTAGLRWTQDTKYVDLANYRIGGVPFSPHPQANAHFERLTPRIILDYKPQRDLLIYGSFATGYKSGGFNERYGAPIAAGPTAFKPEAVKSVELGAKATLPTAKTSIAVAAFRSDYDDIQVTAFDNTIPRTINAARGRVTGIEIEANARPTEHLSVQVSYGYLDAHFTRLDPAVVGSFGMPIINPLQLGLDFVNSPRHTLSAGAEHVTRIRHGTLRIRGDISYRSRTANDAVNTPELMQPALTLMRARISYTSADERFDIALFGTNLTDERYIVSGVADAIGFGGAEINGGRPREWGLSISTGF